MVQFFKPSCVIIIIIEGLSLLQSIPPTTANKQNSSTKEFFLTLMCGPVGYSVLCDVIYVSIYLPFDEACRAQGGEGREGHCASMSAPKLLIV